MVWCPKCSKEMDLNALECPHCGYDFPPEQLDAERRRKGLAYSWFADLALVVSTLSASVGCLIAAFWILIAIMQSDLLIAFVYAPVTFLVLLGNLVVLLRVQDLP